MAVDGLRFLLDKRLDFSREGSLQPPAVLLAHRRRRSQAPRAQKPVAPIYSCNCKTKSNSRVVGVMCIFVEENVNLS